MNVAFKKESIRLDRVWFDRQTGFLHTESGGVDSAIPFQQIPDEDFESTSPVGSFSLGMQGAVVVCHHLDGKETWLPADLWLPGSFTPAGCSQ
jgi:hypothetical protein